MILDFCPTDRTYVPLNCYQFGLPVSRDNSRYGVGVNGWFFPYRMRGECQGQGDEKRNGADVDLIALPAGETD